ncbi:MAG: hypothetical protein RL077_100 [Verrucomicrobiota bacterium]
MGGVSFGHCEEDHTGRIGAACVSQVRSQPVEFLDEFTEDDLRYARLYYDSWKTDGANWFQERFREAVAWIEWNAKMIQKKYRGLRRAVIRRTYFGVFFAIEPGVTTVVAILDLRQDPSEIRRALRDRI